MGIFNKLTTITLKIKRSLKIKLMIALLSLPFAINTASAINIEESFIETEFEITNNYNAIENNVESAIINNLPDNFSFNMEDSFSFKKTTNHKKSYYGGEKIYGDLYYEDENGTTLYIPYGSVKREDFLKTYDMIWALLKEENSPYIDGLSINDIYKDKEIMATFKNQKTIELLMLMLFSII